jgi:hypothetical protein
MAEVENIQETVEEPKPNPYNQRKSWQTDDVMPKEGNAADSLFVAPQPETVVSEEEKPQETVHTDKPYQKADYKKRYDDLKRHYDTKLNEFRTREQELAGKVQQAQPVYEAPKSLEELEQFKNQYPDVYEVVESVAHLQSEDKMKSITDKVAIIEAREQEVMRREAEKDLMDKHPDYSDLRNNDDFHVWAETQPEEIQDWIYNNPNNASLASKAIDLYKMESSSLKQQKPSPRNQAKASEMVSTKTTSVEAKEPKIWTQEEISDLSMDEFDKYEKDIDQAILEGRVRG